MNNNEEMLRAEYGTVIYYSVYLHVNTPYKLTEHDLFCIVKKLSHFDSAVFSRPFWGYG